MIYERIGPWLPQVYDYEKNKVSDLLSKAKRHGLLVHPFTHREDAEGLPDSPKIIFIALKKAGIDGMFTDQIMPYMLEKKR